MPDEIFVEIEPALYSRLEDFICRHPNLSGNEIISTALERYLELEESPSVQIPADLLQDLLQVCIWVQMLADFPLHPTTVQTFAEQANKIGLWGKEYHIRDVIPRQENL